MIARTFTLLAGISMRCAWLPSAGPAVVAFVATATARGCA